MIVLGVDQGVASCGYAVVEKNGDEHKRLASGVIETPAHDTMGMRLQSIMDILEKLIIEYEPEAIFCEKLFFNASSKGRNKSAAMMYVNKSTAVLDLLSNKFKIPIESLTPGTIKKQVTGNGRASKDEIIEKITIMFNLYCNEHEADAMAIAMTGMKRIV